MTTHNIPLALMVALSITVSGCATIYPGMRANAFNKGQPDPDKNKDIVENAEKKGEVVDVEVYSGKLPEGLQLEENGAKIIVMAGYESTYDILGTAESDYIKGSECAIWKNMYWTWDYKETWRKWYCYPQVPLKLATFGIWSYLVPINYPCMAIVPFDETERQKMLIQYIKKVASAMDGNLVVLTGTGGLIVTTIDTKTNQQVGQSVHQNMSLKGFVIFKKRIGVMPREAGLPASASARDKPVRKRKL